MPMSPGNVPVCLAWSLEEEIVSSLEWCRYCTTFGIAFRNYASAARRCPDAGFRHLQESNLTPHAALPIGTLLLL